MVEAVSKSADIPDSICKALGIDRSSVLRKAASEDALPSIAFTPLEEIEKALHRALARIDLTALATTILQSELDRLRGRV